MELAHSWWERLVGFLGMKRINKPPTLQDLYSETVYHDLIHRESKRSERAGQLCRMLLIYRISDQGLIMPLGAEFTRKAASVLFDHVRDTDYIGWYRYDRILGVLLTAFRPESVGEDRHNFTARLVDSLSGALSVPDGHSVQIRVLEQDELRAMHASGDPASFSASNG